MEWETGFWYFEKHKQRITAKQWRDVLLDNRDKIIKKGRVRTLIATNLGYGVVEVSLEPLEEK